MTGIELKAIRESSKLSRAELAVRLGLSSSQVWRYEAGKTKISWLVECAMRSLKAKEAS